MYTLLTRHKSTNSRVAALATIGLIGLTSAIFSGCGDLDCSEGELASKTAEGRTAGTAQTDQERAAGTAAGVALTAEQGQADGRTAGYNEGFNQGKNDTASYNVGYNDVNNGYPKGLVTGQGDALSCNNGRSDGLYNGAGAGILWAQHDGYRDAYYDGYNAAFTAGISSCFSASGGPTQEDRDSCFARGKAETYNASAYNTAYAAAKAANTNYKNGYDAGRLERLQAGIDAGKAQAVANGKSAGFQAGLVDGKQIAYSNCWNTTYALGFDPTNGVGSPSANGYGTIAYNDVSYGYGVSPGFGSYDNGTGGFGDGFSDGYNDGRLGAGVPGCFPYTLDSRFGAGQAWAVISGGQIVDIFDRTLPASLNTLDKNRLYADTAGGTDFNGNQLPEGGLRAALHASARFNSGWYDF